VSRVNLILRFASDRGGYLYGKSRRKNHCIHIDSRFMASLGVRSEHVRDTTIVEAIAPAWFKAS
jgi:hypothetical protein